MTRRTTLGDLKDADQCDLGSVLNIAPNDARFTRFVNQAVRRLLETGEHFWGSHARFLFCLNDHCVTLPRQIANIEAVAVCDWPMPIRNSWFEFLENGYGISGCDDGSCGGSGVKPRGTACCFTDILGTNKKIRVYADVAEAAGAKITLQGYDENKNWIRTQVGGEWIDGEQVLISTTVQVTTKFFTSLTSVLKPETNGTVRLYEYDTTLTTQRAMAVYEPDEKRPNYRRYLIPGLNDSGGACENSKVTIEAKLEFIPVKNDEDWLLIGNMDAIKLACQAIRKENADLWQEGEVYWAKAKRALQNELSHRRGGGIVSPVRMPSRDIWGPAVENVI